MLQKISSDYYINNKMKIYLVLGFFIILLSKIYLSLKFTTPWIFSDEVIYDEIAQNILTGKFFSELLYCQTYPPGYSVFLSIAHLLSNDKDIVYHLMLTINCILTSSVIFPSYFILKKYCSEKYSLFGSLAITTLPSVTLYSFVLMSENLFIALTVFSVWFTIESFEHKENKLWDFFAGISVFYLFFTRATGIAMIIAFLVAFTYYIWNKRNIQSIFTTLKQKYLLLSSLLVPLILWTLYKKISSTNVIGYNTNSYMDTLISAFTNLQFFKLMISSLLHEIEYLILSSYFIFLIILCLFIIGLFKKQVNGTGWIQKITNDINTERITALKVSVVYLLIFSFILITVTVTHMQISLLNGSKYYHIFGRYIDPIVPLIFLFSFIAIYYVFNSNFEFKNKLNCILGAISGYVAAVIIFTFPIQYYKFPNMFPLYYIQPIKNILSFEGYILAFSLVSLLVFYLSTKHKKARNILFIFIILSSIFISIHPFQTQLQTSVNTENVNQIGRYLQNNSDENTSILMDREDFNQPWGPQMWFLTKFWTPGSVVRYSTTESPSGVYTEYAKNNDYIISTKLLAYKCVSYSPRGYKLYKLTDINKNIPNLPYTVDIGLDDEHIVENFYYPENEKIRWSKNSSKVLIHYPDEYGDMNLTIKIGGHRPEKNPANIEYYINNYKIGEATKSSGNFIYSYEVSRDYLNNFYQILEIKTDTWKPSDYGSKDTRELGVQVDWINIDVASK